MIRWIVCSGKYDGLFSVHPDDAQGGLKVWGHYSSSDWIHWDYHGIPLLPDCPYDVSGVYSGSALVDDETMYLYFTGNVKYDGDYDYINNGREGNTVLVESKDGYTIGDKCCVLKQEDYPKDYTCHIRDPKVFRYGEKYYMVLGGRKKDETGAILLYVSKDKKTWNLKGTSCGWSVWIYVGVPRLIFSKRTMDMCIFTSGYFQGILSVS